MTKKYKGLIIVLVIVLALSLILPLFFERLSPYFKNERIEGWSVSYNPNKYKIAHVNDPETALLAFKLYHSYGNTSHIQTASDNLTVDDVYFGAIKNVKTSLFDINGTFRKELWVWRLNATLFHNEAIDENGTVYRGCLFYGPYQSECGSLG